MPFVAKTGWTDGIPTTRSLVGHCQDVAFAFEALLNRSPRLHELLDADPVQIARLTVLAGMHDFGKAWGEWQSYIDGGARRGHVAPTVAALAADKGLVDALGPLPDWFDDPWSALYTALCHHGGPVPERIWQRHAGTIFDADAHTEVERIFDNLTRLFPDSLGQSKPIQWTPERAHLFAGLLMVADWLGSSLRVVNEPAPIRRTLVNGFLDRAGFRRPEIIDPDMGMNSWRPMQNAVGEAPLNRLMLIEDMTGSGKTEAAMRLALRHIATGHADGIRFCVPTRSAATELHHRIAQLAAAADASLSGHVVRAVPGMLDVDHIAGEPEPDDPRPWSITGSRKTGVAPIAVGTVDQALLAVLRVRHSWARRALDARSVLIIDEVHAGDPYMIALVELLCSTHAGPVILMTATLGSAARQRLLGDRIGVGAPYPALWTKGRPIPVETVSQRRYDVEVLAYDNVLTRVAETSADGARVLVVRSTVADALSTLQDLKNLGIPPVLHHSRYSAGDRSYLDRMVLELIGKGAVRATGCVIVATQTCEQSLDIDADLLVTDACPADVFLQRAGRCHRHSRARPQGCGSPRILVIDPGDIEERLTGNHKRPQVGAAGAGWAWVYEALPVAATIDWLISKKEVRLPADARSLVDAATHPDHLDKLEERGEKWRVARIHGLGAESSARQLAALSIVDAKRPYADQPFDPDEHVATRLGEMPVDVLTPGLVSPFTGETIEGLPVPCAWIRGVEPNSKGEFTAIVDGQTLQIGETTLTYSIHGLQKSE